MSRRFALLWLLMALVACASPSRSETVMLPGREETASPSVPTTPGGGGQAETAYTPEPGPIHRAEGAGQWYPAEPAVLQAAVANYLAQAEAAPLGGRLRGIIAPHAGYLYSGAVSGYAFRSLQQAGCAEHTIVVLGDTHSGNGSAQIAVWASGAFETPLGTIPVDKQVAEALVAADPRIQFDRTAFQAEHPVENQLPFLQVACPGARIVPIVIRQPSLQNAQLLAAAIVKALGNRPAFLVGSTDLSHYNSYEQAQRIDQVALEAITSMDPQAVADSTRRCTELGIADNPLTMCSEGAVMTALVAARELGADHASVLAYATSGDSPAGDRTQVVGYGAVALWQTDGGTAGALPPEPVLLGAAVQATAAIRPSEPLTVPLTTQEALLGLARQTAEQFLSTSTFPPFHTDDPALLQPLGAFVTYRKGEELRGCIGRVEGDRPAYLNVQYAAAAAAVADPRFPPITAEELATLNLEITLLFPIHLISSPSEIQLGRDGILLRVGEDYSALFLPQVPTDEGWDLETTLANLSRKAGLPEDGWRRRDAQFYVFAGQWFGEGE